MVKLDIKWRTDSEETTEGDVAIVTDVLRASTTIITAFSLGAREVLPFQSVEEARAHGQGLVLIGERDREKPDGFDFSNAPSKLDGSLAGKTIAFSSTNFPKALMAAEKSPQVLIGALVNVSAACETAYRLALEDGLDVCLMLAGQSIEPHATEEVVFAGLCGERLEGRCRLTASAREAVAHIRESGTDIRIGKHAKELILHGLSDDVEFANRKDIFNIAPAFRNGRITP